MKIKNNLIRLTTNKLSLKKKKYALIIGETPSMGARSPKLWNKVYKKLDKNSKMYPADVSKSNLANLVNLLENEKFFLGAAITTPYKEDIIKNITKLTDEVKKIGSVNTIKKQGKNLLGFNTDYYGAVKSLTNYSNKKKILIVGCGGAGKAVILACIKRFNKSHFYFYNRDKKKLKNFLSQISLNNFKILNYKEFLNLKKIDLIVNTTSVGFDSWIKRNKRYFNLSFFTPFSNLKNIIGIKNMDKKKFIKKNKELIYDDNKKCSDFLIQNSKTDIFDIIYNPNHTKLLKIGKKKGHKIQNGLSMNLNQAIKGFCIVNNINQEYMVKKAMVKK